MVTKYLLDEEDIKNAVAKSLDVYSGNVKLFIKEDLVGRYEDKVQKICCEIEVDDKGKKEVHII